MTSWGCRPTRLATDCPDGGDLRHRCVRCVRDAGHTEGSELGHNDDVRRPRPLADLSVARQILLLQVGVVVVLVAAAIALTAYDARRDVRDHATDRAVAVAEAVADSPTVRTAVETGIACGAPAPVESTATVPGRHSGSASNRERATAGRSLEHHEDRYTPA